MRLMISRWSTEKLCATESLLSNTTGVSKLMAPNATRNAANCFLFLPTVCYSTHQQCVKHCLAKIDGVFCWHKQQSTATILHKQQNQYGGKWHPLAEGMVFHQERNQIGGFCPPDRDAPLSLMQ